MRILNMKVNTVLKPFHFLLPFLVLCACQDQGGDGDESMPVPEFVQLIRDIPYAGTDNPRQTLDLAIPATDGHGEPFPVIAFIHAGAFMYGDKSLGHEFIFPLVETGRYAAVTIGYRLAGEAQWPAQIHDCKAGIRWIRKNAGKYGFDPERIGVWGASAGGNLAAILGTSGDVESMDGEVGEDADLSSRVHCVVNCFGPVDFLTLDVTPKGERAEELGSENFPETKLLGGSVQERKEIVKTINPITYATPDDPPFLICHGTIDPIVPHEQSKNLHEALREAGVESTLLTVEGAGHGYGFGPGSWKIVHKFFAHHLLGEKCIWEDRTIPAEYGYFQTAEKER